MEINPTHAELKVTIDSDVTDVFLNGSTEYLIAAICVAIRSIAINLADNMDTEELKELLGVDEIPREELQELFVPHILTHIMDGLDDIETIIDLSSEFRTDDNDDKPNDVAKNIVSEALLNCDIFDNEEDDEEEDGEDENK